MNLTVSILPHEAKITAQVILPLAKLDWFKRLHYKFKRYDLHTWRWHL